MGPSFWENELRTADPTGKGLDGTAIPPRPVDQPLDGVLAGGTFALWLALGGVLTGGTFALWLALGTDAPLAVCFRVPAAFGPAGAPLPRSAGVTEPPRSTLTSVLAACNRPASAQSSQRHRSFKLVLHLL